MGNQYCFFLRLARNKVRRVVHDGRLSVVLADDAEIEFFVEARYPNFPRRERVFADPEHAERGSFLVNGAFSRVKQATMVLQVSPRLRSRHAKMRGVVASTNLRYYHKPRRTAPVRYLGRLQHGEETGVF